METIASAWRRALGGLVLCAAIVASLACGTASNAAIAGVPDPLAGLTASQIATKAITSLKAASAARVDGTLNSSGMTIGLNLSLVRGTGCVGTMSEKSAKGNVGSFRLVAIGKQVWVQPDRTFWVKAGHASPAVLQVVSGKYLRVTSTSTLGDFSAFCDTKTLASDFEPVPANLKKGATATIGGQRALQITEANASASLYVSDTAQPEVLRLAAGSQGSLDFTDYGTPVKIAAPPASETLTGAKYGF
jgi:hypothetical protein